jgi:hypothetical protein
LSFYFYLAQGISTGLRQNFDGNSFGDAIGNSLSDAIGNSVRASVGNSAALSLPVPSISE